MPLIELPYSLVLKSTVSRYIKAVSTETAESDWLKNDSTRLVETYTVETSSRRTTAPESMPGGVTYRGNPVTYSLEVWITDPSGNRALVERQKSYSAHDVDDMSEVHNRWLEMVANGLAE